MKVQRAVNQLKSWSQNFGTLKLFQYRSNSTEVKPNLISSITNLVYELSYKLPNNLKLRIFANQETLQNISNLSGNQCPVQCLTCLPEMKVWQQQSKNTQKYISKFCLVKFYRMSLFCFKYFDRDCRLIESYKKNNEQKIQKKYQNTIRQQ